MPSRNSRSSRTRVVTPSTTFVFALGATRSKAGLPSFVPGWTSVVPSFSGNHGLSTFAVNAEGTTTGWYRAPGPKLGSSSLGAAGLAAATDAQPTTETRTTASPTTPDRVNLTLPAVG